MSASSSPYVRRLLWIVGCFVGGFALLCVSGWALVVHGSTQDTALVTALRWLPVATGAITVAAGFFLLSLPVPEDPEDFFYPMMLMENFSAQTVNNATTTLSALKKIPSHLCV